MAEAIPFIIKVLAKSMDTSLAPDKVELATLTRDDASGKVRAAHRRGRPSVPCTRPSPALG